ncbi:penicillin-binding protein, 1A family [Litoreibacter ascidiaceicola]|uniref:peptidoglycan glycosyltransferase n=1 Tax=Litoreibacter ascidiaceicola TaxID=1486859 RepID=A0A1M5AZ40_9RHOB|nr:PBP1A family penicillin-binding protein [Litoreibacter ascidiaceicola]SHF35473.1 penicillin-binding protein, 1A family [Litoreibacter ascidiaceicola]
MSNSGRKKPPLVAEKRYSKAPAAKPKPKAKPKPRVTKRKAAPRKRGVIGWILFPFVWTFRLIWRLTWRITAVAAILLAAAVAYTYAQLPPVEELLDGRTRGSVTVLDRENVVFAWRGDNFGGAVRAESVAPALKNAVVATEDKRFYWHLGISPRGVASAMRINMREGRKPWKGNGGSTLTQQTAKLLCLGVKFDPSKWKNETEYESDCRRTTLARKGKEALYALAMEAKYSKNDILSIYLNRAYLGSGARGFEAASQIYFGKHAAKVSVPEAAMLAGLLKAPSTYAPTNNLQRAQDRAATVLKLMREQDYITSSDEAAANATPATLSKAAQARAGGYFVDWVMDTAPDFLANDTTEDVMIRSTFDTRLQKAAEDALDYIFEEKVREGSEAQAAIVVMSADGAVRAMVGGRQAKVSGAFNRAVQAKRQTGSAFKPFVYAAAMDLGFQYDSIVVDEPFTINVPGSGPYTPKNYTRNFKGEMTLTDALAQSINTVAVKVSEAVGRDNVRDVAERFGIDNELAAGPALALGASESTLLEMTGAYAGILNGGRAVSPYGIRELRLKGDQEALFGQGGGYGERVITESAAQQLTYMMYRVVNDGTGRRAKLGDREVAGKTGTTSAAKDAWFIGFTAQYVVGVWMGYDDNTPLKGVTGGGLPAEIWKETMVRVTDGLPAEPLPMIRPANPPRVTRPEPVQQPQVAQRPRGNGGNTQGNQNLENVTEQIIRDVGNLLGKLLGGN